MVDSALVLLTISSGPRSTILRMPSSRLETATGAAKVDSASLRRTPSPEPGSTEAAAELLGYCMLGAQGFFEHNDLSRTEAVENRLIAALEVEDNLDARVLLLALHAGVIQSSVVARYGLEVG